MSTPPAPTSARDEARPVAPTLAHLAVSAGRPAAMTAERVARQALEGAKR